MRRSYSKKGYPWDNACIESFHALIKREWLNRLNQKIKTMRRHAYGMADDEFITMLTEYKVPDGWTILRESGPETKHDIL